MYKLKNISCFLKYQYIIIVADFRFIIYSFKLQNLNFNIKGEIIMSNKELKKLNEEFANAVGSLATEIAKVYDKLSKASTAAEFSNISIANIRKEWKNFISLKNDKADKKNKALNKWLYGICNYVTETEEGKQSLVDGFFKKLKTYKDEHKDDASFIQTISNIVNALCKTSGLFRTSAHSILEFYEKTLSLKNEEVLPSQLNENLKYINNALTNLSKKHKELLSESTERNRSPKLEKELKQQNEKHLTSDIDEKFSKELSIIYNNLHTIIAQTAPFKKYVNTLNPLELITPPLSLADEKQCKEKIYHVYTTYYYFAKTAFLANIFLKIKSLLNKYHSKTNTPHFSRHNYTLPEFSDVKYKFPNPPYTLSNFVSHDLISKTASSLDAYSSSAADNYPKSFELLRQISDLIKTLATPTNITDEVYDFFLIYKEFNNFFESLYNGQKNIEQNDVTDMVTLSNKMESLPSDLKNDLSFMKKSYNLKYINKIQELCTPIYKSKNANSTLNQLEILIRYGDKANCLLTKKAIDTILQFVKNYKNIFLNTQANLDRIQKITDDDF